MFATAGKEVSLPFTNRVTELNHLKSFLDDAISGRGSVVFISGEPGIGKTRLAEQLEIYSKERGFRCLRSKCYRSSEVGNFYPYSSCVQFIRQLSNEASIQLFYRACGPNINQIIRLVPELTQNLPKESVSSTTQDAAPSSPEVTQREEMQFLQTATQFFFNLSKESPLLLFVDDWQWCDSASVKLLQFIRSNGLTQHPILILCALRELDTDETPEDRMKSHVSEFLANLERERSLNIVQLKRFDPGIVAELLKKAFSRQEIRQEFLNLLYARTGGNPFFIEEVLKALIEEGKIFKDQEGMWQRKEISEIVIPHSVSGVIKNRLSHLGIETERTLSVASVLGETFDFEILKQVLSDVEDPRLREQLENAARTGLILKHERRRNSATDSQYSFCDESVRDSLYYEIPLETRTGYHDIIARALEEFYRTKGNNLINGQASELALHFQRSGNITRSIEYYVLAGKQAARLYAHRLACQNFHSALDLITQLKVNRRIDGGEREQNLNLQAELLDLLGFEAQFVPSEFQNLPNYWEESARIFESIGARKKASNVLTNLGRIYYVMIFDLDQSSKSFAKALQLLEEEENADSELAHAYAWNMIDDVWKGDRESILAKSRKAMEIANKVGALDVISMANQYLMGALPFSDFEKAMSLIESELKTALEHNLLLEASLAYFHRAVGFVNTKGPTKQALDLFLQSLEYSLKTDQWMTMFFNKTELAYEVYLPLGEWRKAEELAEDVRRSVQDLPPSSLFSIISESVMGQVLLCKGESEKAEQYLKSVETKTKGFGIFQIDVPLYMSLARLYINKGEYEKGQNYLNEAYRRSKKRGLVIINCVPHVRLLSLMIEFALKHSEKERASEHGQVDLLFSELSESCSQINEEWALGYLQKTQGEIDYNRMKLRIAEGSLKKSVDTWRKLGWRYELGRSLSLLGDAFQSQAKIALAVEAYGEALQIFEELGAKIEIENITRLKNECERVIRWSTETGTSIEILSDEKSRTVFDYLVKAFIQDQVVNKLPLERCGWRSLRMIEKEAGVPGSILYAKTGGVGSMMKQLLESKLVESAIFSGERGRGGEITRVRIAYMTNTMAREFVDREIRNKS